MDNVVLFKLSLLKCFTVYFDTENTHELLRDSFFWVHLSAN